MLFLRNGGGWVDCGWLLWTQGLLNDCFQRTVFLVDSADNIWNMQNAKCLRFLFQYLHDFFSVKEETKEYLVSIPLLSSSFLSHAFQPHCKNCSIFFFTRLLTKTTPPVSPQTSLVCFPSLLFPLPLLPILSLFFVPSIVTLRTLPFS